MEKLIQHIPDEQFKMNRYYGLYATADHKHKKHVQKKLHCRSGANSDHERRIHYRRSLIDTFGVDPLLCTCGTYMQYVDSYVPSRHRHGDEPP